MTSGVAVDRRRWVFYTAFFLCRGTARGRPARVPMSTPFGVAVDGIRWVYYTGGFLCHGIARGR